MSYIGIDYGQGRSNRDPENGVRYGVISQHSISQAWCDSAEPDYGKPTCPKCGNEVRSTTDSTNQTELFDDGEEFEQYGCGCADYVCENCEHTLDSSDCYGEEPIGWSIDDGEYIVSDCLDSDVIIIKSPYYTFVQFCSPCVPGAGNLESPMADGVKCYCLGHDWFEQDNDEGKASYPVYSVATDELVNP